MERRIKLIITITVFINLLILLIINRHCSVKESIQDDCFINHSPRNNLNYSLEKRCDSLISSADKTIDIPINKKPNFIVETVFRGDSNSNNANQIKTDSIGISNIIEITEKESSRLGFDIRQHVVFYRNCHPNAKCYFSSINWRDGLYYDLMVNGETIGRNVVRQTLFLRTDTFPDYANFYSIDYRWGYQRSIQKEGNHYYNTIKTDFYPNYLTDINGKTILKEEYNDFLMSRDTLIPILIPFSRLSTQMQQDHIFWFNPTAALFDSLPDRFHSFRNISKILVTEKRQRPDRKILTFDYNKLISEKSINVDSIIDGRIFFIQLNESEMKEIGLYYNKSGIPVYNYITPIGHSISTNFNYRYPGTDTNAMSSVKPYFADFFCKYETDLDGQILYPKNANSDVFNNENDVLLPILFSDRIVWLTIGLTLWEKLPERYQSIKKQYNMIMFNKSVTPDRDFVIYFPDHF